MPALLLLQEWGKKEGLLATDPGELLFILQQMLIFGEVEPNDEIDHLLFTVPKEMGLEEFHYLDL